MVIIIELPDFLTTEEAADLTDAEVIKIVREALGFNAQLVLSKATWGIERE